MKRWALTSLLIAGLLLAGCDKRPDNVLSEDRMVNLLADIEMADAYYNTQPPGANRPSRKAITDAVLQKHGISEAEMDSTIAYYGRNLDEYYALYEKVGTKLKRQAGMATEGMERTTDDIWPYNRFAAIFPNQLTEGMTFSIPADDLEPGNSLEWSLRLTSGEGIEALLGVEYANGVSTYVKRNVNGKKIDITLQTDTAMTARRIFGVLNVPGKNLPVWADSISLVKVDFDSLAYSTIRSQKKKWPPVPKKDEAALDSAVNGEEAPLREPPR